MNNHIKKSKGSDIGRRLLSAFLMLSAVGIFAYQIFLSAQFSRDIKGHLKLAADANTIELAESKLGKALENIEARGLTEGHTSVFYEVPTEDIGFWYTNLKASKEELAKVRNSSQLEKTNTLIKLRETLLDAGSEGKSRVTIPKGLHRYPNNLMWGVLSWYALFAVLAGFYYMFSKETWAEINASGSPKPTK